MTVHDSRAHPSALAAIPLCLALAMSAVAPRALVGDAAASTAAAPAGEALGNALASSTDRFADEVVLPALDALAVAARRSSDAAAAFEDTPDAATLEGLRDARLATAVAWARMRPFAFGPMHSLGHDVALDFPIDQAGIERLLAELGDASVADIERRRLVPSLTGLGTMAHLLRSSDDPADFPTATRRYLHALARRVDRAAAELLAVWRDGHDGRPAFAAVLASAGEPDNHAYLSVESAAEEIVRGLIDCLDVVVHEELAALIATPADADPETFAVLGGTLDGVESAYRGADIGAWFAADEPAAEARLRDALDEASGALGTAPAEAGDADVARAALERTADALEHVLAALETHALPKAGGERKTNP